ncbi:hypothetical protein SAMN04488498_1519 [Mesorhizobium albiziae]|uniref:Antitoxin VbhA domain-containing protein n=1 Tax=Neomesorhizobium albiziae TaxID=335020 RepID=A0A1I4FN18_9HYPH|nr:hypothetical protein GCM10007937_25970 [Mesorhizobium albiziae]SFL18809.1 hypothetical protein SAMN04488498_1519 [Mesorhizobium albiziae]
MALALKQKTPAISPEEMERRRKMVRSAQRSIALEGVRPDPAAQPIFDASIAGEIEVDKLMRWGRRRFMHISYKRHRFPAEIIAHAVWLYYRFPLSLRPVRNASEARDRCLP